jgi:hypothetical protein
MTVLHGEVAAAAIARQHGIHETLVHLEFPFYCESGRVAETRGEVHKWKRQFLEAGKQRFEDQRTANPESFGSRKRWERLKTLQNAP